MHYLLTNSFSSKLKDLKRAKFNDFLKLIEERKSNFRKVLTIANDIVNEAFFNLALCAKTIIRHSQYLSTSLALN